MATDPNGTPIWPYEPRRETRPDPHADDGNILARRMLWVGSVACALVVSCAVGAGVQGVRNNAASMSSTPSVIYLPPPSSKIFPLPTPITTVSPTPSSTLAPTPSEAPAPIQTPLPTLAPGVSPAPVAPPAPSPQLPTPAITAAPTEAPTVAPSPVLPAGSAIPEVATQSTYEWADYRDSSGLGAAIAVGQTVLAKCIIFDPGSTTNAGGVWYQLAGGYSPAKAFTGNGYDPRLPVCVDSPSQQLPPQ